MHVNENGFVTLGNNTTKPYNNAGIDYISTGTNRGSFPLQYFDEAKHFEGGNSPMDGSLIPEKWGKPYTAYEGNLIIPYLLFLAVTTQKINMVKIISV